MVGSSSISLDNRSNALLVYLAKPITKGDYLIGKWMGVFLAVFAVALVPSMLLYLYCLLSYYSDGFLTQEPWLWLRVIAGAAIPAAIHASLIIGFSAWSKTPRMAGAVYAGLYFISSMVSTMAWGISTDGGDLGRGIALQHLSVGGLIGGLQQNVYSVILQLQTFNRNAGMAQLKLDPPSLKIMLSVALGLIVLGIAAARLRIRAVEVVKG
jgi:ABC-2 type transport system permease protein